MTGSWVLDWTEISGSDGEGASWGLLLVGSWDWALLLVRLLRLRSCHSGGFVAVINRALVVAGRERGGGGEEEPEWAAEESLETQRD